MAPPHRAVGVVVVAAAAAAAVIIVLVEVEAVGALVVVVEVGAVDSGSFSPLCMWCSVSGRVGCDTSVVIVLVLGVPGVMLAEEVSMMTVVAVVIFGSR